MYRLIILTLLLGLSGSVAAQELYVNTEPASNMATKAIGIRLNTDLIPLADRTGVRVSPEVMFGLSRYLMVHANLYSSNFYQPGINFEGGSIYAKYRFLAFDQPQSHFRVAAYGRVSVIKDPVPYSEINLQGDNSGMMGGLVFTQLLHKLALSASADVSHATDNISAPSSANAGRNQAGYTFSAGYLLLPKSYTDYKQTNLNVYIEFLGKDGLESQGHYLDAAPALQLIFNSRTRIDFSYRKQLAGHMSRIANTSYLIRFEHTLFNAF